MDRRGEEMDYKQGCEYYRMKTSTAPETKIEVPEINHVQSKTSTTVADCDEYRNEASDAAMNFWSEEDIAGSKTTPPTLINYSILDMQQRTTSPVATSKHYTLPLALSNHFSIQGTPVDGTVSAICHSCGSIVKSSLRATSNLITHLKRCDANRYARYCVDRKGRLPWVRTRKAKDNDEAAARVSSAEAPNTPSSAAGMQSFSAALAATAMRPTTRTLRRGPMESTASAAAIYSPRLPAQVTAPPRASMDETPCTELKDSTSPMMKHFKLLGKPVGDSITGRCLNCGVNVKASVKATSNFITHIKRCSPARYEQYCNDRGRKRSLRSCTEYAALSLFQPAKFPDSPPYVGIKDSKQRRMMKHLLVSMATDHLPCDVVTMPNFRNFISEGDSTFEVPQLENLNDVIIPFFVQKLEEEIKSELKSLQQIYLNLDIWTDPNSVTFLCFFVNFIDESWKLVTRFLGVYPYESRFKASSLTSAYNDVVDKFNIRQKVKKILADNTFPFTNNMPTMTYLNSMTSQNEASSNISDDEFWNLISFLPEHIGSFSQRQHLCVIKDALNHESVLSSPISTTLWKSYNLMTALLNSPIAVQTLMDKGVDLESGTDFTDWISLLESVALIAQNPEEFRHALNVLETPQKDSLNLTDTELLILKETIKIISPFVESVRYLEGGKLSAIGPIIIGLKNSLLSMDTSQLIHCQGLWKLLSDAVKNRLESFLSFDDVKIASCLDPRFKLDWIQTQNEKDQILFKIKNLMSLYDFPDSSSSNRDPKLFKMDSVFENLKGKSEDAAFSEPKNAIDAAIAQYLEEATAPYDSDPLTFWKSCSAVLAPLSATARLILPCVSNSLPNETLDNIFALEKCYRFHARKTGDRTFKSLAFIGRNSKLFNDLL